MVLSFSFELLKELHSISSRYGFLDKGEEGREWCGVLNELLEKPRVGED